MHNVISGKRIFVGVDAPDTVWLDEKSVVLSEPFSTERFNHWKDLFASEVVFHWTIVRAGRPLTVSGPVEFLSPSGDTIIVTIRRSVLNDLTTSETTKPFDSCHQKRP